MDFKYSVQKSPLDLKLGIEWSINLRLFHATTAVYLSVVLRKTRTNG